MLKALKKKLNGMKKIALDGMRVIHTGEEWLYPCAPCSKVTPNKTMSKIVCDV